MSPQDYERYKAYIQWNKGDTLLVLYGTLPAALVLDQLQEAGASWLILTHPKRAGVFHAIARRDALVRLRIKDFESRLRQAAGYVLKLAVQERTIAVRYLGPIQPFSTTFHPAFGSRMVIGLNSEGIPKNIGQLFQQQAQHQQQQQQQMQQQQLPMPKPIIELEFEMNPDVPLVLEKRIPNDLLTARVRHKSVIDISAKSEQVLTGKGSKANENSQQETPGNIAVINEPSALVASGSAPQEMQVGLRSAIRFRLEQGTFATPLPGAHAEFLVAPSENIRVMMSTNGCGILYEGVNFYEVAAPQQGEVVERLFLIVAMETGNLDLAIQFFQSGSEIARLIFKVWVVERNASPAITGAQTATAARELAADDMVDLLIQEQNQDGQVRFRYILTAINFDIRYREFLAPNSLKDRGGGHFQSTIAYVDWIYRKVARDIDGRADANKLQRTVNAIGDDLCRELFDHDFVRTLWPLRHRIRTIHVVSWEPLVPWELLRLRHPETGEKDDKFLAEYGLVRELQNQPMLRRFPLDVWQFIKGNYKADGEHAVGGEVDYFTNELPTRGIHVQQIEANDDAFYEAMAAGNFDVLHIACHGRSQHDNIEHSELILCDVPITASQEPHELVVDSKTMVSEAKLKERRPIVFLNACDSGRLGPSLTGYSGWAADFFKAGAGIFIGTSWPVREQPSRVFAETFYNALLDNRTLAEAATEARLKTKETGDASWLAYKVFGYPLAKRGKR